MSHVEDMRAWLLDCYSDEDDQDEIKELTGWEVYRCIHREFRGGVNGFMETYN